MKIYIGLMDPPVTVANQTFVESVALIGQPVTYGRVLFVSHDVRVQRCVFRGCAPFAIGLFDVVGAMITHNLITDCDVAFSL